MTGRAHGFPGGKIFTRAMTLLAGALVCAGCAHNPPGLYGGAGTSSAPHVPWVPPARAIEQRVPEQPSVVIPPELLTQRDAWQLPEVVDIALRGSAETRAAWDAARSAAAAYGSQRGDYLPDVNLNATVIRQKSASTGTKSAEEQRTYGGSADFTWLLFNFGGRHAAVEETRQALLAADWTHNAAIQDVVLRVERAYYEYIAAKSLLAAETSTLEEVQIGLASAEERHRAGLATIADVLQARTALSQVQLSLASLNGRIATTRGALATSMGLPANTPFDVELPPVELPLQQAAADVEQYLQSAKARRPDLAAARAQVLEAEAHVRSVKAEGFPSLSAAGNLGRVYRDNPDDFSDPYSASLQLRLPLFTGFSHEYDVLQSRADAQLVHDQLADLEQRIVLQVWTSYYEFKTAEQRLKTIEDLLRSATESHAVALGRYKAGVGTILDLLAAQAALEGARAQNVQARADWFISLAQLAHDSGTLMPPPTPASEIGAEERQEGSKP
jgi:outer membrane protein